jgi:hypothetical protein
LPTGAVQPIVRRDLPKRYADALMRAMAPSPDKRFESLDEMLEEILAPRPPRFRFARLVVISAAFAAAFVTANEHGWIMQLSAVATALKSELAAASARVAGSSPSYAGGAGSTPVLPPPPEATPTVAASLPEPPVAPEAAPAPELTSAELMSAELEPAALEPAAPESMELRPVALQSELPVQVSEAGQQGETDATTPAASASPDPVCDDKPREPEHQCLDGLQDCRPPCE